MCSSDLANGPVTLDFKVTEWWSKVTGQPYSDPLAGFRRNEESPDGKTFAPNPITAGRGDLITLSGADRRMSAEVKCLDIDGSGYVFQNLVNVTLDPSNDAFVAIGSRVSKRPSAGSAGVVEMMEYNPKTKQLRTQAVDITLDATGQATRTPRAWSTPVACSTFDVTQETTFDSVKEVHDFVLDRIGLPFVFDTSPDMAVWNYPVDFVQVDQVSRTETADGIYTRYKLRYTTEGGPSGDCEYLIKRDAAGKVLDTCAVTPMPDFAFREERLVMGAVAVDERGRAVYNNSAASTGALFDANGGVEPGLAMYERQLKALYAALTNPTDKAAYIYEDDDGKMYRFTDKVAFDAAIAARETLDQPV